MRDKTNSILIHFFNGSSKSLNPTPAQLCLVRLRVEFKLKNKERRQQSKTILTWQQYLIYVDLKEWVKDFEARFNRLDHYLTFAKFGNSVIFNQKYFVK